MISLLPVAGYACDDTEVEAAQANYSVAKATRDDALCLATDPCLLGGADVPDRSSVAMETVTCTACRPSIGSNEMVSAERERILAAQWPSGYAH